MSFNVGNDNFWNNFFDKLTNVSKTEQEQNTKEAEQNAQVSSNYVYHEETPDEEIVFDEQFEQPQAKQEETQQKGLEADKTLHDIVDKYAPLDIEPDEPSTEPSIVRKAEPFEPRVLKYAILREPDEPSIEPSIEQEPLPDEPRVFKYAILPDPDEPTVEPSVEPSIEQEPPMLKYAMPPIETVEPSPEPEPLPLPEPAPSPTLTPMPTTPTRPIFRPFATSRGDGIDLNKWGGWQSSFFGRGKEVDLSNPWKINRVQTFVNVLSNVTNDFGKRLEGFMKDIFPGFRR